MEKPLIIQSTEDAQENTPQEHPQMEATMERSPGTAVGQQTNPRVRDRACHRRRRTEEEDSMQG